MDANSQPEPIFTNERGEFKVTLYRSAEVTKPSRDQENATDLLQFCRVRRTRKKIVNFLGLSSVTYAMQKYVQPLIDSGDIVLSNPDAPQSRKQLYAVKTE